jgi:exosortase A
MLIMVRFNKEQILAAGLICIFFIGVYFPTFSWMISRFLEDDSNYSHGFLIPFICLWLVWLLRDELKKLPVNSSGWGLMLICMGLVIHVSALCFKIDFISALSMIITIVGIIIYIFGWNIMKFLYFPVGFLIFMIPFPDVFTILLTFKLKMLATYCSVGMVNLIGIPCVAEGAKIILPDTFLEIGAPCSGIRSLISLLALGALFAYLLNISLWKRVVVFISAVPIAIFSNIVRVFLLCLIAHIYGKEKALGFFHDFSGLLVFVIAFVCLYGVGKVLSPGGVIQMRWQ